MVGIMTIISVVQPESVTMVICDRTLWRGCLRTLPHDLLWNSGRWRRWIDIITMLYCSKLYF